MEERSCFFVEATNGRKFKMVIRGDLRNVQVEKIRRYLKSYGVPDGQVLRAHGMVLTDDMIGEDFGLCDNFVLQLTESQEGAAAPRPSTTDAPDSDGGMLLKKPLARGLAQEKPGGLRDRDDPGSAIRNSAGLPNSLTTPASPGPRGGTGGSATRSTSLGPPSVSYDQQTRPTAVASLQQPEPMSAAVAREVEELRKQVEHLQGEVQEARAMEEEAKMAAASAQSAAKRAQAAAKAAPPARSGGQADVVANGKASLLMLAEDLGVNLQFDANMTCVVGADDRHTVLITLDTATERLFVYSTLLTALPEDSNVRMKLYEILLEGSLLGRDVCGGGIGLSLQNELVMLSTSLPMRYCEPQALRDMMPAFVETVARWRELINELVSPP